uniref:Uncharacterized protein n=1 Tax=Amphimedon queenslandica TaxID=400682 RepID=A0A1X7TJH1_AMPQE
MEFASIINTDANHASIDIYAARSVRSVVTNAGPYFSLFGPLGRVNKLVCIGSVARSVN